MPDEDVSLRVRATETISKAFEKIKRAVQDTEDEIGDLGDKAAAASGAIDAATEGMEQSFDEVDDEIDEINRALNQLILTSPAARAALESIGEVDLQDRDDFIDFREMDLPSELVRRDPFRSELVGRVVDDDMGGLQRRHVSQSLGSVRSIETVDDLVNKLQEFNAVEKDSATLMSDIRNSAREVGDSLDLLGDKKDSAADSEDGFNISTKSLIQSMVREGSILRGVRREFADMSEEFDDATEHMEVASRLMDRLLLRSANLSANIGPFNIALGELGSTFFGLSLTIGPLVTLLGGMASAIVAAAAAAASFVALGFLDFAEQLQQQFIGIEDTAGAIEAIFKGLKQAVVEALAPLRDVTIAGLTPMEMAVQVMRDLVTVVNLLAHAFASMIELPQVQSFLLTMRELLLGVGDAGRETAGFFEALEEALIVFLPAAEDFLIWLVASLPAFFEFSAMIGEELIPALREFGPALIRVIVQLVHLGSVLLSGVLPAVAIFLNALSDTIELLGDVAEALGLADPEVVKLIAQFIILGLIASKIALAISGLITSIKALATILGVSATALGSVAAAIILVVGFIVLLAANWNEVIDEIERRIKMWVTLFRNAAFVIKSEIKELIGWLDQLLGMFGEAVMLTVGTFFDGGGPPTGTMGPGPSQPGSRGTGRGSDGRGPGQSGMAVTVNVDNRGNGTMDEREASRVGDAVARRMRDEQRREDGFGNG